MELQLALDRIEKKRAIDIVESLKDLLRLVLHSPLCNQLK